jgi:hypothetical protein
MPAQMTARQRAAFVALAAAFGGTVTFGGKVAEPVETVGKAPSKGKTGVVVGSMTTAMARKLVASGKETYESLREKAAGGKCLNPDCGKRWATCDANRGGPTTHTC